MTKKALIFALFNILSLNVFPCSSVFIASNNSHHDAAVGRTMDFPHNLRSDFAFGAVGLVNTSNINLTQETARAVHWDVIYPFIGINAGFKVPNLIEGMNNQGLYAGYLYLPGITTYPSYNATSIKPALGVLDIANFILGTASNVPAALDKLNHYQLVQNGYARKKIILSFPLHLVMHDKLGNSAVIEWIDGNTVIYYNQALTHTVQEIMNGKIINTFNNFDASVVTNSPQYSWQINNAKEFDTLFNGNTSKQNNGLYMNGSGMSGLPGDFTPPSRLARGYQLAKLMPQPTNTQETLFETKQVLNSMTIPLDANPSPTVWSTISDLGNNIYYYKPILKFILHSNKQSTVKVVDTMHNKWKKYDLNTMDPTQVPSTMLSAQILPGHKATHLNSEIQKWLVSALKTKPNTHVFVHFFM